ncbi:MAG: hypothetical protein C3F13_12170 [Anaerolineales bacterium]|nr:hypothetical protein [Anaerolineae bacterium]PWB52276.1 MAG: hypothetical protein C3F13_12170 [Anaerolineales bacterium]
MKKARLIEQVIDTHASHLIVGEETVDSIIHMHPQIEAELRAELEALKWLGSVKTSLEPRPGFIAASSNRLVKQLASNQASVAWEQISDRVTVRQLLLKFAVPLIIITILVLFINSLILTARLSIPGDPFYSIKLLSEGIHLAVTRDPIDKAALYTDFSRERTTEFVELVLNGKYEELPAASARLENEIIAALHSINYLKNRGLPGELSETLELKETLVNEISMLSALKGSSPPAAYNGMDLAIQVSQEGLRALR